MNLPNNLPVLFDCLLALSARFDMLREQPFLFLGSLVSAHHGAEQIEVFVRGFHGQRTPFLFSSMLPNSIYPASRPFCTNSLRTFAKPLYK